QPELSPGKFSVWRPSPDGRHSASLCRSVSSRVIAISQSSCRMVGTVERQQRRLAVHDGLQVDRPAPDRLDVRQRGRRVIYLQFYTAKFVTQKQFPAIVVVPVHDVDERLAKIRQAEQQPLLDLLEVARLDDVLPHLLLEGVREQLVLDAELRRQEGVDEG